jgi:hypothetical protein
MEGFVEPAVAEVWGRPAGGGLVALVLGAVRRWWRRTGRVERAEGGGDAPVVRRVEPVRPR